MVTYISPLRVACHFPKVIKMLTVYIFFLIPIYNLRKSRVVYFYPYFLP